MLRRSFGDVMKKLSQVQHSTNQKKITHFFRKAAQDATSPSPPQQSSSSNGRPRQRSQNVLGPLRSRNYSPKKPTCTNAAEYEVNEDEVKILTPPPAVPKECIDLVSSPSSSSSSDTDLEGESTDLRANNKNAIKSLTLKIPNEATSSMSLSTLQEGEIVLCSPSPSSTDQGLGPSVDNSTTNQSDTISRRMSSDSSGDEILSQIDIDEVVRLSQSSASEAENDRCSSPSLLEEVRLEEKGLSFSPRNESSENSSMNAPSTFISSSSFKLPKKSPKSQVNKYSPKHHLRLKRSSSEANLDFSSPSPTSAKLERGGIKSQPDSNSQIAKRRLQFESSSSSGPVNAGSGGGGRYHLRNFMGILTEVVGDKFHSHLLDNEDHRMVQTFTSLSLEAQSLYVRLFQRKWEWKPLTKLNNNYKDLPPDLTEVCGDLTKYGFVDSISDLNSTLEDVLDTLDLPKMITLAKKMMVSTRKKTKEALRTALLAKVKSQKTLSGTSGSATALKYALIELGPAFRVSVQSKTMFSRLFLLYSPPHYWEVEQDQASNQLLITLLNNMGQMEYTKYKIQKATVIYKTREDLIKFQEAFSLHSNLVAFSEAKDYNAVVELANQASALLKEVLANEETTKHDNNLPKYLRIYTAGSVLTHTCWMGVDGFQKLKQYKDANNLIQSLLDQSCYLPNYRGRCWERLAINGGHLKQNNEDIKKLLESALRDPCLQDNHKLILSQRLDKLRQAAKPKAGSSKRPIRKPAAKTVKVKVTRSTSRKYIKYIDDSDEEGKEETVQNSLHDLETQVVELEEKEECGNQAEVGVGVLGLQNEIPTRTIEGEKMDKGPGSMGKSVFISKEATTGANRISSVEQHAIQYYMEHEGYTNGIHGEGSTVVTLYGLLFWDIIFLDNIPDAFHNKYQAFPLDLHFDDFYMRRKELIEEKLELIRNILSAEDLCGIIEEVWTKNKPKLSIVSWTLFEENLGGLKSLTRAMGNKIIAVLCGRLAKNYRYYSSGFPDVVVWDSRGEGRVLFAEVKGPGDTLSPKQQLWLDFLVGSGIPAEVCHVKAVSNKRIRRE